MDVTTRNARSHLLHVALVSAALCVAGCDGSASIGDGGDATPDAQSDGGTDTFSSTDTAVGSDTHTRPDSHSGTDTSGADTHSQTDTGTQLDTGSPVDTSTPPDTNPDPQPWGRVAAGQVALYSFDEGDGTVAHDLLGPHDLTIEAPAAVSWSADALTVDSSTRVRTDGAAAGVIDAIRSSGQLTLEAWLTPAAGDQTGPARIVSLSQDPTQRDLTLGQGGSRYVVRLRTTTSDANGLPQLDGPTNQAVQGQLTHVAFTRDGTTDRLYVGGVEVASRAASGDLSNWASYGLVLANEADGSRPWLGTFHMLAVYDRALSPLEIETNFGAGPEGDPTDVGADPTPPPVTDPGPDPDPTCIGETLLTNWNVSTADHQRQFELPLETGVQYDKITIELEFDPAVWGELCYNPVWSPPRLFEPFHYLVALKRGTHWCKGGNVFTTTMRGPGANRMLFETYHKDQPHTGSGCGSSTKHEIFRPQTVAPQSGQFHTATIVYDHANGTASITIDGQTFNGTTLPAADLSATATTPLVLELSFHDWLECFDETGAKDDSYPCCHIPSPGWSYRNVSYEICR